MRHGEGVIIGRGQRIEVMLTVAAVAVPAKSSTAKVKRLAAIGVGVPVTAGKAAGATRRRIDAARPPSVVGAGEAAPLVAVGGRWLGAVVTVRDTGVEFTKAIVDGQGDGVIADGGEGDRARALQWSYWVCRRQRSRHR